MKIGNTIFAVGGGEGGDEYTANVRTFDTTRPDDGWMLRGGDFGHLSDVTLENKADGRSTMKLDNSGFIWLTVPKKDDNGEDIVPL